jgi:hypothetical protein
MPQDTLRAVAARTPGGQLVRRRRPAAGSSLTRH